MKLTADFNRTRTKSWPLLVRCTGYFKPYAFRIGLAVLSITAVAGCWTAVAFLAGPALKKILVDKDVTMLMVVPILYVALFVVKGVFQFLQNYLMKYCGLKVLEQIRNELYNKLILLPLRFYEENQVGMLMSRILNDVNMMRMSLPALVMVSRQILTMIGLIAVAFIKDSFLAFWAVLVLPLAFYPFFFFARKLRKYGRRNQSKIADITTLLQEIFSGIRVVKAFVTEKKEMDRFSKENARLVVIGCKEVVASELSSRVMELIGALGVGLVIWFGGYRVVNGYIGIDDLISFVTALAFLYEPVKKMNDSNSDIQWAMAGAERVFELLDSPVLAIEQQGSESLTQPFTNLAFEQVTFTYDSCINPALAGVDLKVRPGERLAIVGPSGSGKTTLVNMVPRFYEPQQGRILLNDRPVQEYTLASLRRFVGMVSQDTFLFNATVHDNIAYGLDGVTRESVEQAARAAYAHEFILELPNGYETIIGERGVKLSGGQKQRLTIARALLKNPPLLILDEATSALDTEAERLVQMALDNLLEGRTSIVIAHRLSTIITADRILVMESGRIIAQGPHSVLLEQCELYAKLYQMQFQDEPPVERVECSTP